MCTHVQLCLTLCNTMDCSPPGSSVHGILQARIPEWVAISLSREERSLKGSLMLWPLGLNTVLPRLPSWLRRSRICLQCRRRGLGRSPEEGNGNPLWCSCLENSMDRGAWWATVKEVAESWTRLSYWTTITRLATAFLPRTKCLLISWLQSPSAVIWEPK